MRTILAADIVSLIGAGVLWYLSVGSVGLAFFLGLSTILDLVVTWFFVRPRRCWCRRRGCTGEPTSSVSTPVRPSWPGGRHDDRRAAGAGPRGSLWHRLYHGETNFDFVGKRRIGFIASGILIVASAVSLIFNGLNLGIDFEGGRPWEFEANGQTVDDAQAILEDHGIDATDAKIQTLSGPSGERLRVQVDDQPDDVRRGEGVVRGGHRRPGRRGERQRREPDVGEQITRKALRALVVFFLLITIYISIRFEWKMAIAVDRRAPRRPGQRRSTRSSGSR